ncbi:MAG: hypothetical protein ACFB3T_04025 [Geminicoccaceae bacterium]
MGTVFLDRGDGRLSRYAGPRLLAVMTYPHDSRLRRTFLLSFDRERRLVRDSGRLMPAGSVFQQTFADAAVRWPHAVAAGETLLSHLRLRDEGRRRIPLGLSADITASRLRASGRKASLTSVTRAWHAYRPVSHLWAAHLFWRRGRSDAQAFGWMRQDNLGGFLALAVHFHERGCDSAAGDAGLDRHTTWHIHGAGELPCIEARLAPVPRALRPPNALRRAAASLVFW